MAKLDSNQLLLLNNLIYLNKFIGEKNVDGTDKYDKVDKVINFMLKENGLKLSESISDDNEIEYPVLQTREEWIRILTNIQNDDVLMSLKITNGVDNSDIPGSGMRVACFVDQDGDTTVVFRGTSNASEWHDNGVGGYQSDTPQQQEALAYIESLSYNNITVTGHSKGGNKAQYVAILSDKIDRCVSFDGQGFSKEFMAKYQDDIIENAYKVTSISDEYDFVNCLMLPLPLPSGQRIYIKSEYTHKITEFLHNHCPNTMLESDGKSLHEQAE